MKVEGQTITLDAGEEITIRAREKDPDVAPPTPSDDTDGRLRLFDLLDKFNQVLRIRGYNAVDASMGVWDYLAWAYDFTKRQYESDAWMFKPETYPLLCDYRGNDTYDDGTAYNALQSWLMASILSELVPDSGTTTNTQTELFKLAYETGGGRSYPLYNRKAFKADPYAMREAASVMYAICRGDNEISAQIDKYRSELGGRPIPAATWDELDYVNKMLSDDKGRRGYQMTNLGYCVNTSLFLPDAPGPRVPGTTVCELPWPWEQGQSSIQFNTEGGNYLGDERINTYFVKNYGMMSQTPLSLWNSYPIEKQNRLVNVAAIPPCTFTYMFSKKNVKFDGIVNKSYDGKTTAEYFCFSETDKDTGLALDGPFSDLQGMYRYNTPGDREECLEETATIFDNFRFPTEDPNYGRCRPGCKPTRQGGELNPVHGAAENEIYNVDLTTMVADTAEQKAKMVKEDGFAADSPRSYVSGHSAQIWGLALMLTQMNNEGNCEAWIRKAFEYSINRSVGRFHWNSDCIYGRLFGAMALPILNAMSGMKDGLNAVRDYVLNPTPAPAGNWDATVIIKNDSGRDILSTGEVRLYVGNHEYGINVSIEPIGQYMVIQGENAPYNTQCVGNAFTLNDSFDGMQIDQAARIYLYSERWGHVKSEDANLKVTLDTDDPRCSLVLRKSGATYVLKVVSA